MNKYENVKLKPCPFCGGEPEYTKVGNEYIGFSEATIKCKKCFVQSKQKFMRKKFDFDWIDEVMIEHWNTRISELESK